MVPIILVFDRGSGRMRHLLWRISRHWIVSWCGSCPLRIWRRRSADLGRLVDNFSLRGQDCRRNIGLLGWRELGHACVVQDLVAEPALNGDGLDLLSTEGARSCLCGASVH